MTPNQIARLKAAIDAQAAFSSSHGSLGGSMFCLNDSCPWHPGETRLERPRFNPAILVEGTPSLVVIDVAALYTIAAEALANTPEARS